MNNGIMKIIAQQITSGRWILTVVAGFVFAYAACTGLMPADDIDTILAVIITFYFTKKTNEGASDENGSSTHVQ